MCVCIYIYIYIYIYTLLVNVVRVTPGPKPSSPIRFYPRCIPKAPKPWGPDAVVSR